MINNVSRALVVAAHPDDDVLGCGGTIARLKIEGKDVRVMFLAEGVMARYDVEQFENPEVIAASKRRNANAYKALAKLGVPKNDVFLSEQPCCRLDSVPLIDLVKQIEKHIVDFDPDAMFVHASDDVNVDHVLAHKAALAAVRPVSAVCPDIVVAFEVLSSTEWNPTEPFQANVFVDISETIEQKIDSLAAYEDEMREPPHPRSEHGIRGQAAYRGCQSGFLYAEAFSLVRHIIR